MESLNWLPASWEEVLKNHTNKFQTQTASAKDKLSFFTSVPGHQDGSHTSEEVVFMPRTNDKFVISWPWPWPYVGRPLLLSCWSLFTPSTRFASGRKTLNLAFLHFASGTFFIVEPRNHYAVSWVSFGTEPGAFCAHVEVLGLKTITERVTFGTRLHLCVV